MGFFGKSKDEELIDQAFRLAVTASERLIQAEGIRIHRDEILNRAPWLTAYDVDMTTEALRMYAIALTSFSALSLEQNSNIKDRPFFNMAIQPDEENRMVSLYWKQRSRLIIEKVRQYDDGESDRECIAEVIRSIVVGE